MFQPTTVLHCMAKKTNNSSEPSRVSPLTFNVTNCCLYDYELPSSFMIFQKCLLCRSVVTPTVHTSQRFPHLQRGAVCIEKELPLKGWLEWAETSLDSQAKERVRGGVREGVHTVRHQIQAGGGCSSCSSAVLVGEVKLKEEASVDGFSAPGVDLIQKAVESCGDSGSQE